MRSQAKSSERRLIPVALSVATVMTTSFSAELGDEQLVGLAQDGHRQAFEVLVERYKHKAYQVAFDFTRDREEAKDLSQEAFLRAYTHIGRFDRRAAFYTWFYRILVNLCIDHHRRRSRFGWETFDEESHAEAHPDRADGAGAPDRQVAADQLARKVEAALAALPAKQRTAFILKNHQDLTIQEISRLMQTAEGTVKTHLHRAVAALRERLAGIR